MALHQEAVHEHRQVCHMQADVEAHFHVIDHQLQYGVPRQLTGDQYFWRMKGF